MTAKPMFVGSSHTWARRVACLLVLGATSPGCIQTSPDPTLAEIQRVGGKFEIDETAPGRPLVSVDLSFTPITDTGLKHLRGSTSLEEVYLCGTGITDVGLEHLGGLTDLRVLDLWRCKNVTDAGLAHLEGMTRLRRLSLWNTEITDAGLQHLKGLTYLQELDLSHTQVTGAGLQHLRAMTGLRKLELIACEDVTDADIHGLKEALPELAIAW
jgi:hypothetical protein